jgi:hypothetical protein
MVQNDEGHWRYHLEKGSLTITKAVQFTQHDSLVSPSRWLPKIRVVRVGGKVVPSIGPIGALMQEEIY